MLDGLLKDLDTQKLMLACATAIGAFGGFPKAPKFFGELVNNEMGQWAVFFVLVWQGGAGQDLKLAALVTGLFYVLSQMEM